MTGGVPHGIRRSLGRGWHRGPFGIKIVTGRVDRRPGTAMARPSEALMSESPTLR